MLLWPRDCSSHRGGLHRDTGGRPRHLPMCSDTKMPPLGILARLKTPRYPSNISFLLTNSSSLSFHHVASVSAPKKGLRFSERMLPAHLNENNPALRGRWTQTPAWITGTHWPGRSHSKLLPWNWSSGQAGCPLVSPHSVLPTICQVGDLKVLKAS